jgi:hypothetical protein
MWELMTPVKRAKRDRENSRFFCVSFSQPGEKP